MSRTDDLTAKVEAIRAMQCDVQHIRVQQQARAAKARALAIDLAAVVGDYYDLPREFECGPRQAACADYERPMAALYAAADRLADAVQVGEILAIRAARIIYDTRRTNLLEAMADDLRRTLEDMATTDAAILRASAKMDMACAAAWPEAWPIAMADVLRETNTDK